MKTPCALLPVLLLACAPQSPEAQVKARFEACVKAIEVGDAAAAASVLSPKFQGPEGLDRGGAQLYLLGLLRREKVGITVLSSRVELRGGDAFQSVELLLTGREGGGLLPSESSRRAFVLRWEKRQGAWLLRELWEGGAPT